MDQKETAILVELASSLTSLVAKETTSTVNTKIKSIQLLRDIESVRNSYDAIINELLSEREEAVRIAQVYRAEVDRYQISDEDIHHLHVTAERVIEIIQSFSSETNIEQYTQIKELISIDTLKAAQLLGFNYKQAIGEPLTELCAKKITSLSGKSPSNKPRSLNNKRK